MNRHDQPALSRFASAAVIIVVLGASAFVGRRNAPDRSHPKTQRWYNRLDKPDFTPPDAVFGAVWPVIEVGLGAGAYRLLRQPSSNARTASLTLLLLNTVMIGGWTQLFFRARKLGQSAAASGAMIVSGAGYVATAAKVDRLAAAMGVPFVAWIGFATLLAERIWAKNIQSGD